MMSCSEAEEKKYSCRSRSSWPAGVRVGGIEHARERFGLVALAQRADMVAGVEGVEQDRVDRLADHSRSVLTRLPRQPTTGVS